MKNRLLEKKKINEKINLINFELVKLNLEELDFFLNYLNENKGKDKKQEIKKDNKEEESKKEDNEKEVN